MLIHTVDIPHTWFEAWLQSREISFISFYILDYSLRIYVSGKNPAVSLCIKSPQELC